jgi:hypothetical protein
MEEERSVVWGLMGEHFVWAVRICRRGSRGGVGVAIRRSLGVVEVINESSLR